MISRLWTFFFGFLLGGIVVYTSLHIHVVRAEDGFHMVPKLQSTLSQTYVDIRGFGIEQWNAHRLLAASITRAGKTQLFRGAVVAPVDQAVREFFGTE